MISLKAIVEDWVNNQPKKVIDRISPSQIGGCHRAHFYKIKGIEMTTPPETNELMNFQMGFVWEDVVEKALKYAKEEGLIEDYQTQVNLFYDDLNMSGTADFFITDKDELTIWDTKTMRSKWFWYLTKTNKAFLERNSQYEYQVMAYLLMARHAGYKVERGALAFISKDDSFFGKEAVVEYTDERESRLLSRVRTLNGYLEKNELPPCECEGWKVGYCDFGNPKTREPNKKKKIVNTECCSSKLWEGKK